MSSAPFGETTRFGVGAQLPDAFGHRAKLHASFGTSTTTSPHQRIREKPQASVVAAPPVQPLWSPMSRRAIVRGVKGLH
jgi:hypothetical protein